MRLVGGWGAAFAPFHRDAARNAGPQPLQLFMLGGGRQVRSHQVSTIRATHSWPPASLPVQAPLPEDLHLGLVDALVSCTAAALEDPSRAPVAAGAGGQGGSSGSGSGSGPLMAQRAITELGAESGVLGWSKLVNTDQAEFVVRQARRLATALAGGLGVGRGRAGSTMLRCRAQLLACVLRACSASCSRRAWHLAT